MNPFRILGLSEAATADDVKQAWRRLASEHHPDKGGDADSFHRLRTAYEDALSIASAPAVCPRCGGRGWLSSDRRLALGETPMQLLPR